MCSFKHKILNAIFIPVSLINCFTNSNCSFVISTGLVNGKTLVSLIVSISLFILNSFVNKNSLSNPIISEVDKSWNSPCIIIIIPKESHRILLGSTKNECIVPGSCINAGPISFP
eukprot:NODE_19_length_39463_cov_0.396073.p26 type:complete len:115 gc:universal NODE_19_length_39463_cov_0.396073:13491-13147(-)